MKALTPYSEYQRLGKTDEERQAAYRQLFKPHIAEHSLTEIREATNLLRWTSHLPRPPAQGQGGGRRAHLDPELLVDLVQVLLYGEGISYRG